VLSFLSSFDSYLDVVVNCTRKTELRSWQTLFSYLPPVLELFEQSLAQDRLNTAAGYLLVLHAFEQDSFQIDESAQLLRLAGHKQNWELCKELARFLVGIDSSGGILNSSLIAAGFKDEPHGVGEHADDVLRPELDTDVHGPIRESGTQKLKDPASPNDYFSINERMTAKHAAGAYFASPQE
jgi:hypothetical protein